jgi:hypothetical protein
MQNSMMIFSTTFPKAHQHQLAKQHTFKMWKASQAHAKARAFKLHSMTSGARIRSNVDALVLCCHEYETFTTQIKINRETSR